MALDEMKPFLGRPCQVVVRCRACGGRHTRHGQLKPGQRDGDLLLSGFVYSPDEVVSIQAAEHRSDQAGDGISMAWVVPVMAYALGLAGWLRFVHR